jgi:hypothetical protein
VCTLSRLEGELSLFSLAVIVSLRYKEGGLTSVATSALAGESETKVMTIMIPGSRLYCSNPPTWVIHTRGNAPSLKISALEFEWPQSRGIFNIIVMISNQRIGDYIHCQTFSAFGTLLDCCNFPFGST